jgi:hypothetical protein
MMAYRRLDLYRRTSVSKFWLHSYILTGVLSRRIIYYYEIVDSVAEEFFSFFFLFSVIAEFGR